MKVIRFISRKTTSFAGAIYWEYLRQGNLPEDVCIEYCTYRAGDDNFWFKRKFDKSFPCRICVTSDEITIKPDFSLEDSNDYHVIVENRWPIPFPKEVKDVLSDPRVKTIKFAHSDTSLGDSSNIELKTELINAVKKIASKETIIANTVTSFFYDQTWDWIKEFDFPEPIKSSKPFKFTPYFFWVDYARAVTNDETFRTTIEHVEPRCTAQYKRYWNPIANHLTLVKPENVGEFEEKNPIVVPEVEFKDFEKQIAHAIQKPINLVSKNEVYTGKQKTLSREKILESLHWY